MLDDLLNEGLEGSPAATGDAIPASPTTSDLQDDQATASGHSDATAGGSSAAVSYLLSISSSTVVLLVPAS